MQTERAFTAVLNLLKLCPCMMMSWAEVPSMYIMSFCCQCRGIKSGFCVLPGRLMGRWWLPAAWKAPSGCGIPNLATPSAAVKVGLPFSPQALALAHSRRRRSCGDSAIIAGSRQQRGGARAYCLSYHCVLPLPARLLLSLLWLGGLCSDYVGKRCLHCKIWASSASPLMDKHLCAQVIRSG